MHSRANAPATSMTIREMLAGAALQGLLTRSAHPEAAAEAIRQADRLLMLLNPPVSQSQEDRLRVAVPQMLAALKAIDERIVWSDSLNRWFIPDGSPSDFLTVAALNAVRVAIAAVEEGDEAPTVQYDIGGEAGGA